jgi:hypothetical protein
VRNKLRRAREVDLSGLASLSPGALVFPFEIIVCLAESAEDLGGRLEQGFGFRVLDFLHVLSRVLRGVVQHSLDIGCVMPGIILGRA